jgi:hypothetical protein
LTEADAARIAEHAARTAEHAEKVVQLEEKLASSELSATSKYGLKKQLAIAKAAHRKLATSRYGV